ncbi:MAG: hypothetical protein KF800_05895 [Lysobacter sp.]|nr:hypothetical protein [Lysobacter sp.]
MLTDLLALLFFAVWHAGLFQVFRAADRRIRAGQTWRESSYLAGVRAGRGVRHVP